MGRDGLASSSPYFLRKSQKQVVLIQLLSLSPHHQNHHQLADKFTAIFHFEVAL